MGYLGLSRPSLLSQEGVPHDGKALVTRDPSGTPDADDARGPVDSPQLAASRFPRGLAPPAGEAGSVPGYEFEGSHTRPHQPAGRPRGNQAERGAGYPDGPQPPRRPGRLRPAPPEPGKRFRYTSTVSQPPQAGQSPQAGQPPQAAQPTPPPRPLLVEPAGSGYQPAPPDGPVVPGFEFDQRIERSALFGIDPDLFGMVRPVPGPAAYRTQDHPPPDSGSPGESRARSHRGAAAGTEWATLVRSFLPPPAKRNWSAEFRAGLHFRGWVTRVGIPILAVIVLIVAVVVVSGANGGRSGPSPSGAALGFPPASLAGSEFTAAPGSRGISQPLDQVASDGTEIVAVGSQHGARIARAQFYVSLNGGRTWTMGSVRTPDGAEPPPGHAARFVAGGVAGGHGQWVAVGPDSIWTSTDGRTWTLSATPRMPLLAGDQDIGRLHRGRVERAGR
jgi:hypothetical protein